MKIVWDEPKRLANLEKHGVDFADIGEDFFLHSLVGPAKQGRFFAVGKLDRTIVVFFARLGSEGLSIVSARPAKAKERKLLE